MKVTLRTILAVAALCASGFAGAQTLLNASYDVAREFYKDYNPAFVAHYKKTDRQGREDRPVAWRIQRAGAGRGRRPGCRRRHMNTTPTSSSGRQGRRRQGLGQALPGQCRAQHVDHAVPGAQGQPKGIKDWDDLVKPGVAGDRRQPQDRRQRPLRLPGGLGYVKKKGGSDAQAQEFMAKLYKNVPVLARGGRDATTAFLQRNTGDVLITFEIGGRVGQQGVRRRQGRRGLSRRISILAENPVAVVERTVAKKGTARAGQGLPAVPVLGRGTGDRGQALDPAAHAGGR